MTKNEARPGVPVSLWAYIAVVGIGGMAWLVYLVQGAEWGASATREMGLFILLVIVAGSFPMRVGPSVKTDVTVGALFSAAILLEPGVAALAGVAGVVTYTALTRFRGERLRLPWYKYPFNAGQISMAVGLSSLAFHTLVKDDILLSWAIVPAAATYYMANTVLVSVAAGLQLGANPPRIWWKGTKENGLAELSLFAFGFLGAVAYRESPWAVLALFIPMAIIYLAFSRLASSNARLEDALLKLEALQGRIVSTSKLASIGAISMDLAHQIKNPLAILLGRLEGLEDGLQGGSRAERHLAIAMDAGWRIQELTQTFSSIGQHKWVEMDVCSLLDEAFGMAGRYGTKMISIFRQYEESLPKIRGNPVLIREALSNIFSNSMDAVEEGGIISIRTSQVDGEVVLRVSDNGAGIPEARLARLFEPFYSTKPNGQGLGLFAATHIVEMHQGSVAIESVEGAGTCVTVRLPALLPAEEASEYPSDTLLSV